MSKAILEFNLPDEKDDFTAATKGIDYWLCLWDLNDYLRHECKYNANAWGEEGYRALETVRNKFFDILNGRNCSLDDLS